VPKCAYRLLDLLVLHAARLGYHCGGALGADISSGQGVSGGKCGVADHVAWIGASCGDKDRLSNNCRSWKAAFWQCFHRRQSGSQFDSCLVLGGKLRIIGRGGCTCGGAVRLVPGICICLQVVLCGTGPSVSDTAKERCAGDYWVCEAALALTQMSCGKKEDGDLSMKIIYVISAFESANTGAGGHYYSLQTIAEAFKEYTPSADVSILSFGDFFPLALESSPIPVEHIDVRLGGIPSLFDALQRIASSGVTHLHAFDRKAFFFARVIGILSASKIYLTKPGGPNPKFYFPVCEDLFLFSRENLEYFTGHGRFNRCRKHLLPNRVKPPKLNDPRVGELSSRLKARNFIILRIARIGEYYLESIRQTVNLAQALREMGQPATALLIGYIQSENTLSQIKEMLHQDDVVITDKYFAQQASGLIPVANAVVGTGRSLMEAALCDRLVLCPIVGSGLPLLVRRQNVQELMSTNFSERSVMPRMRDDALAMLRQCMSDQGKLTELLDETRLFAAEYFNVADAMPMYERIYSSKQRLKGLRLDDIILLCGVVLSTLTGIYNRLRTKIFARP